MTTPHISPDGLWRWDGTQWVANPQPLAPRPVKKRMSDKKIFAIVIGGVALVLALAAAGGSEPNVYAKFQPTWEQLTPAQQDAICTKFEASPNTAKRDVATALGHPGDGDALAGQLLSHVC